MSKKENYSYPSITLLWHYPLLTHCLITKQRYGPLIFLLLLLDKRLSPENVHSRTKKKQFISWKLFITDPIMKDPNVLKQRGSFCWLWSQWPSRSFSRSNEVNHYTILNYSKLNSSFLESIHYRYNNERSKCTKTEGFFLLVMVPVTLKVTFKVKWGQAFHYT